MTTANIHKRKTVVGIVTSSKMNKTIVVSSERFVQHPKYRKYIRRGTSYKAHDEKNEAREGDSVRIEEARPTSKTKRWRLVEIVRRGPEV
ncbi:MAG TPA: 30S ribosomal protein S17 [Planctomycetota bacterium]|nr:30S ribosomal protein S17 [Planctomycetota bacterium]